MEHQETPAPSVTTRNKRPLSSSIINETDDSVKVSKTNQTFRRYRQLSLLARCALDDEDEIDSNTSTHEADTSKGFDKDQASSSHIQNSKFKTSRTEKSPETFCNKMKALKRDREFRNFTQNIVFRPLQVLPPNNTIIVRKRNRLEDYQEQMEIQPHASSPRENNLMNPSFDHNWVHFRHNSLYSIPCNFRVPVAPHDLFRFTMVSNIFRNCCDQRSEKNIQRAMNCPVGTKTVCSIQPPLCDAFALSTAIHNDLQNNFHKTGKVDFFSGKKSPNQVTPLIHQSQISVPFNSNEMQRKSKTHKQTEDVMSPFTRFAPLWTPEDEEKLSTQQCWLRKQLETFPASEKDVSRHARWRNRQIAFGEVGIQCIHCKHLSHEGRGKGSSYFPSTIASIYQSAQNILFQHFKEDTCPLIPRRLLREMVEAGEDDKVSRRMVPKAGKSRTGGGKSFWAQSASKIGLVDTVAGIRYSDDSQNYLASQNISVGSTQYSTFFNESHGENQIELVDPNDKSEVTDFCFLLLSLYVPHSQNFLTSEIDTQPSVGISCRFCAGAEITGEASLESRKRSGVFLSVKASTLMRNKSLAKLYGHSTSCRYIPDDIKQNLVTAKNIHLPQCNQLKKGWKKTFFEIIVFRLRNCLDKT